MERFEKEFVRRYPNYEFLVRYLRAAIEKEEVTWCDLTATNLTDFVEYLEKTVSPNSASTYCAIVKSFLNMVSEEADLPTMKFAKILRVKKVPQQNVALTEDEVRRIDEYYQKLLHCKTGRLGSLLAARLSAAQRTYLAKYSFVFGFEHHVNHFFTSATLADIKSCWR